VHFVAFTNSEPARVVEQVARRSGFHAIALMIENKFKENRLLVELPWEVILHVLSFLEPYDLCTVSQVCVVRPHHTVHHLLCPVSTRVC
jgi:hypothetical protein